MISDFAVEDLGRETESEISDYLSSEDEEADDDDDDVDVEMGAGQPS